MSPGWIVWPPGEMRGRKREVSGGSYRKGQRGRQDDKETNG